MKEWTDQGVAIEDHVFRLTTKNGEEIDCAHMRIFSKGDKALAICSQMPGMWKKNFIARTQRAVSFYEQGLAKAQVSEDNFSYVEHFHGELSNLDGVEYWGLIRPFRRADGELTIREESNDRQSISRNQVLTLLQERVIGQEVHQETKEKGRPENQGEDEPPFGFWQQEPSGEANEFGERTPGRAETPKKELETEPLNAEELELLQQWTALEADQTETGVRPERVL